MAVLFIKTVDSFAKFEPLEIKNKCECPVLVVNDLIIWNFLFVWVFFHYFSPTQFSPTALMISTFHFVLIIFISMFGNKLC